MSDISAQIWNLKYRLKAPDGTLLDHDVAQSWARVALALAQAETGDFKAAIATLDSFRDEADKSDQRRLKKLREQFKAKQPLRE